MSTVQITPESGFVADTWIVMTRELKPVCATRSR